MEHLAHRCATVAAAALAVGGLVAVLTPATRSQPDVQIRAFDLANSAAANVDVNPGLEVAENQARIDFPGHGGLESQQVTLGDLLFGHGENELGTGSPVDIGDIEKELSELLGVGGTPDPQSVLSVVPSVVDFGGVAGPSVASFSGGSEQAANAAVASLTTGMYALMQGLPVAYQSLLSAIASAELAFNNALVEAQLGVVGQMDGDSAASEIAHFIFLANNAIVAQNEQALNSLLGIDLSGDALQNSLFGGFDPGSVAFGADWDALLASFSPDTVSAVLHDNLALLLTDLDIPNYLASFILGIF